jgi:hypothetical protein
MTLGVATVGLDVRLVELLAVEAVVAVSFRPRLAGKGDDPLDEDAARPLRLSCEICTYSGFVLAAGTERLGQEALSAAVGKAGRSLAPCLVRYGEEGSRASTSPNAGHATSSGPCEDR